jgi:CubicO group peptidase (beta-lactamase class C family)
VLRRFVLALASLFFVQAASATVPQEPAPSHELTGDDVGTWLDGFLPWALTRADLAGAVVTVVKDGQVLFARGYGYADMAKRTPVDPANTLFRIGSVSKLFTWTAVMQQVEQGKLDLDRNVNDYLDFKIPDAFGKPITLRHVMTHSAGFEEQAKDLFPADTARLGPPAEFLKTHIPARVYPPGEIIAYSNYGAALAGYIVERSTGRTFDDYIEQQIYAPLGMTRATFRQPLPAALEPYMAQGYLLASQPPRAFELVATPAAGSMSATGLDMAKFMIAHLDQGGKLLQPATAAHMHAPARAPAPGFNAMALGFYQEDRNGRRIVGHGGNLPLFHTDLHLLLDEKVGLFVSFNAMGKDNATGPLRLALLRGFLDRYFPAPRRDEGPTLSTAREHGQVVAGSYTTSRAGVRSWLRLAQLFSPVLVTLNPDDTISVSSLQDFGGAPKKWREVEPFVWREVGGVARVTVLLDREGQPSLLAHDDYAPVYVHLRSDFATGPNALPLLRAAIAILLLPVFAWPAAALVRRRYGLSIRFEGRDLMLYRLSRGACLLLALVPLLFLSVATKPSRLSLLSSSREASLHLLQLLGVVALVGAALLVWRGVHVWRDARFGWWGRIANSAIALAGLVIVWAFFAYNLLDFGLHY